MLFTRPDLHKQGILCSVGFFVEYPCPGGILEGSMRVFIYVMFYVSFYKWKVTECVNAHVEVVTVTTPLLKVTSESLKAK